ncbi:DUF2442 domain-containing protein [Pseudomonas fluorescens]|uniref:DUF2442 domain-containing protein n=1 Tax=Pseudomonas fluorescens TaxID=294 RepID=UPI001903F50E|nr:DUF2442 domain-containing protein [Pseudomonas fluorescens]MBD8090332.1 DUF2442 domain-containing protein [Pseudomonas fluorescens]MBD8718356.1 DUF2442 domain-containing protein [Pseudomonas fluorescens]
MTSKLRISAVQPVAGKHALQIEWNNGKRHTVDLLDHINAFPILKPLLDLARFGQVEVGEWGFDVTWGNDLELSAVTLHRLALEQSGEVMLTQDFRQWMLSNNLSLSAAAVELGFSRRTITAYSSGAALIPKHVGLACKGWEYEHKGYKGHYA